MISRDKEQNKDNKAAEVIGNSKELRGCMRAIENCYLVLKDIHRRKNSLQGSEDAVHTINNSCTTTAASSSHQKSKGS